MKFRFVVSAALLACAACSTGEKTPPPRATNEPAKILMFYASPAVIGKGRKSLLCYGTEAATDAALEPAVEAIKPSLSRCVEVTPAETTTYRLTASGPAGNTAAASATVTIDPKLSAGAAGAATLIRFLAASSTTVAAGENFTICYSVAGTDKVELAPLGIQLPAGDNKCTFVKLTQTTQLELRATAPGGAVDREKITITVR